MNEQTKKLVAAWLESFNGDVEKCARWMRDTARIGGLRECRELINQANGGQS